MGVIPGVAGLTLDSRLAGPGIAFAALPGRNTDGHAYLEAAIRAGAACVVVQEDRSDIWSPLASRTPIVVVPDTRAAAGQLAAAAYKYPARDLRLIGVTGTDGKTTTTHLTAHVLDVCGLASGYLTSVGFETGSGFEPNATHMTTLEAPPIQAHLAAARDAGRRSMVIEASSEGLAQHRLDGCEFDVAVFTNLSRDHLDFHGTMENYLTAKGLLFVQTDRTEGKPYAKAAVINGDDAASTYLLELTSLPATTYGLGDENDLQAIDVVPAGFGLHFRARAHGNTYNAQVPLLGRFNVYNSLAAAVVASSQGVSLADAFAALSSFPGIPGRMERIDRGQPFSVFVDIASTPVALENTLSALRPGTTGKLWVVFGAAGGRDPARRDGMGRVAGRLADRSVLTSEDPRDEDPDAIIETIAAGLRETGHREDVDFVRQPDRREAIRYAFEHAEPGDTVLLAGKSTETTMVVRGESIPWDERALAADLLEGSDWAQ